MIVAVNTFGLVIYCRLPNISSLFFHSWWVFFISFWLLCKRKWKRNLKTKYAFLALVPVTAMSLDCVSLAKENIHNPETVYNLFGK